MRDDLARAFVACPGWQWLPGMLYAYGPYAYRHTEESGMPGASCFPVVDDPATVGCILELVRLAWGDPTIHVVAYHTIVDGCRALWWALASAYDPRVYYVDDVRPASLLAAIMTPDDVLCARPTVPEVLLLALQNAPVKSTPGEAAR